MSTENGPRAADRVVALTFDDGPSSYTNQVLDILKRERIRATFFVVGENIDERRADLRREIGEGNLVGNHTFTHIDTAGGGSEVAKQLTETSALIKRETDFTPCLFRPPGGTKTPQSTALINRRGLKSIGWDVDTQDYTQPGSDSIVQTVLRDARPGSIVLMHDGGGPREQTVAALPRTSHCRAAPEGVPLRHPRQAARRWRTLCVDLRLRLRDKA